MERVRLAYDGLARVLAPISDEDLHDWEITSREETEDARESARQIPAGSRLPGTESPLEIWLGRSTAPEQI